MDSNNVTTIWVARRVYTNKRKRTLVSDYC